MKQTSKARLERDGWKVGNADEFLGLDEVESALVDVRVSLARALRQRRRDQKISQATLAKRVGSSQSRVAKMEAGDPSVTIDLLMRTLLAAGSTRADLARVIAAAR
ncbi:MAG: helix-turn-helix transcriptional regulator [Gemmatimonadales bacterium]|jgi:DNA-binding XRE family transcriptional regulator